MVFRNIIPSKVRGPTRDSQPQPNQYPQMEQSLHIELLRRVLRDTCLVLIFLNLEYYIFYVALGLILSRIAFGTAHHGQQVVAAKHIINII